MKVWRGLLSLVLFWTIQTVTVDSAGDLDIAYRGQFLSQGICENARTQQDAGVIQVQWAGPYKSACVSEGARSMVGSETTSSGDGTTIFQNRNWNVTYGEQ